MPAVTRCVQQVLMSLRDPDIGRIVIYGTGGTGKTWTAKRAMHLSLQHRLFDVTIWVTLSIDSSLRQVQKKILEKLSIPIEVDGEEDDEECGVRIKQTIHTALSKIKFLLILDDVWLKEHDVVGRIGIPDRDSVSSSKILVTTRSQRVLATTVPDVQIQTDGLSLQESWRLFRERAGGDAVESQAVLPISQEVIAGCLAVPLAITLVGGALKGIEDAPALVAALENALSALSPETATYNTVVYRAAKFGYNMLPAAAGGGGGGDGAKDCLLYCALFPQGRGVGVDELIRYWTREGFLGDNSEEAASHEKGRAMLENLINRSLLCKDGDDRVTMHGDVREVVSDIGRTDGKIFGKAGPDLITSPGEQVWRSFERISLMDSRMEALPESPRCPKLSTLLLQGNRLLRTIPDAFFSHMQSRLRVLDLSYMRIKCLPSSLAALVRLRVLLARNCEYLEEGLHHINSLHELESLDLSGATALKRIGCDSFMGMRNLKILNLSQTSIEELPQLINLHNLRHLLLSGCRHLKLAIQLENLTKLEVLDLQGTLLVELPLRFSKLTRLKHLNLIGTRHTRVEWETIEWLPEGLNWDLCTGSNLTTELQGNINGTSCISVDNSEFFLSLDKDSQLWDNGFRKFHFCVCPSDDGSVDIDVRFQSKQFAFKDIYFRTRHFAHPINHNRYLEICSVNRFPNGIEGVLNHAELVSLNNNAFMRQLSDLGLENMKVMRECWIERCDGIDSVFNGEDVEIVAAIGSLENLWVSNLANLRCLCMHEGMDKEVRSFACLKHLHLDCCPNLISLFSSALHLENLETLQIKFCDRLESVFGDSVLAEVALPRLHTLCLWELPELKSICEGVLPALKNLKVKECPMLRKIPVGLNDTSPLVVIRGEQLWWNNLLWGNQGIKSHLLFRKWGRF